ncbi:SDR family oxidoreductase [Gordonia shandongensis]|uniref:SDR family oxidoreductase n=1 Tax=Gordonia shandongensis TaxID=376351 RepID=UPI0004034F4A|nr:SDR family oxidoreductase [Gordonia shandongensis]
MKITVVGASGQFGSILCDRLDTRGAEVVRAHRGAGVDAVTGAGLAEACAGADVIVDATNLMSMRAAESEKFFSAVATNIARTARATGAAVVYLTIHGAPDPAVARMGHYRGKAAQERVYSAECGDTATAVASTQWYSLAETFLSAMRLGPIAAVPHMVARPAAVDDVADAMADVVLDPARPDRVVVAGPEVMDMLDVARMIAAADGTPKKVVGVRLIKGLAGGALVPQNPDVVTTTTVDDWLAAR